MKRASDKSIVNNTNSDGCCKTKSKHSIQYCTNEYTELLKEGNKISFKVRGDNPLFFLSSKMEKKIKVDLFSLKY